MKKRIYRAMSVKDLDLEKLGEELPRDQLVMGLDIAKRVMFGVLMSSRGEILAVLRWHHLRESRRVVAWVAQLPIASKAVALEPSGTYGDTLRHAFQAAGVPVYRVSAKHTNDARELYDGVPSSHDAKSAAIVAWLHQVGRSVAWKASSERARRLAAAVQRLALYESSLGPALNRLESQLTRYWPEVLELLELSRATLLELLSRFGGPEDISRRRQEAQELMHRVGGPLLSASKIAAVLDSAEASLGVSMIAAEREVLQDLALEARRRQRLVLVAKRHLQALSQEDPRSAQMASVIGPVSAAVLVSRLGSLAAYPNTGSLLKAAGLNLKERSSGRRQGQLALTKRGSGQVRQYLYLAVLRWIQKDRWAQGWYQQKVNRDGGKLKLKALIALMRKLLCGLWWVARGHRFDSTKLFDTRRLEPQMA